MLWPWIVNIATFLRLFTLLRCHVCFKVSSLALRLDVWLN